MAVALVRRLRQLLDVDVSSIADGEVLAFNATTGTFVGVPSAGGGRYVHDQPVAAATWTISHGLSAIPSAVAVIDTAGSFVVGSLTHLDANTVRLDFSAAFSGKAYIGI